MLLIISPDRKIAKSVRDTFHFMSILSYSATPHEALSEVSGIYRAALIINPERLSDVSDYVKRLKAYKRDLPVFALTGGEGSPYYPDIFDATFTMPTFTPALAESIISYANEANKAKIGDYYLAGFDASSTSLGVRYFGDSINFTRTEAMILRFLIVKYPIPISCAEIVKYAFRESRAPSPTSIRTHISLMNKKLSASIGKPMITFVPRKGYIIMTPEHERLFQRK